MQDNLESVKIFRQKDREENISKHYYGWLHFTLTTILSIAIISISFFRLRDVQSLEWLTIPLTFLYANIAEYFGHIGPMHHLRKPFGLMYQRHTKEHHVFFTDKYMEFDSSKDFKAVLFPIVLVLFFFGLIGIPSWLLLYWLFSSNVAWLFSMTAVAYFLNYEWLHFAYHCSEESWLRYIPGLKKLRQLHLHHHNQKLMSRYNFNITYPIGDILFGTYYKASTKPTNQL